MAFRYGFRKVKTAEWYLDKFIGNYRKLDLNQKMVIINRIENQHKVEELEVLRMQLHSEMKRYESRATDIWSPTTFLMSIFSFLASLFLILGQLPFNIASNLVNSTISLQQLDLKVQLDSNRITYENFKKSIIEMGNNSQEKYKDILSDNFEQLFIPMLNVFCGMLGTAWAVFYALKFLNNRSICKITFYQEVVEHCINNKTK